MVDAYTSGEYLTSNGLQIPFTPQYFERMTESHVNEGDLLRKRYEEDGYLCFRSFLDQVKVWEIRKKYFSLFDAKIFKEGTEPMEGVFSGQFQFMPRQHGHEGHPAAEFVKEPEFEMFTNQKKLYDIAAFLLGGDVIQLKRKPLRHFYKDTCISSRAHSDFTYLDNGTSRLLSVWIPLGDIPLQTGSLVYLKQSSQIDVDSLREQVKPINGAVMDSRPISQNLKAVSDKTGLPWLYSDFKAGDIVIHDPFIVHASLDCTTDKMRLSTDLRFARASEQTDARWVNPWRGDDGY
jgi:ectoine hydroxylase-related dioxygenase (phytanoyl-CoA dioxygenase family)